MRELRPINMMSVGRTVVVTVSATILAMGELLMKKGEKGVVIYDLGS